MQLLFFFSSILIGISSHDIHCAHFKIYQEDETVLLDIVLEKEDIKRTFSGMEKDFSHQALRTYLTNHFSIAINQEDRNVDFGDVVTEGKHFRVKGKVADAVFPITSLQVYNTCLLNITDHSNIIEVRLEEQERDFLMNSKRTLSDILL